MKNEKSSKFYAPVSEGKKEIQVILENKKICFMLNQKKVHEEDVNRELHINQETLIKKHDKKFSLNGTTVELIEFFNGVIMQIGKMGISIYKNIDEFREKTVEYYSKKADVIFYEY